jgi:peptide/nickel transport system substrate-binding protein
VKWFSRAARSGHSRRLAVAATLVMLLAAACGGSGTSGSTATTTGGAATSGGGGAANSSANQKTTLTWATITPVSMSPLKALAGNAPFLGLAYDPLFYISGNGDVKPALATQWSWEGQGNKVLDVTLRDGVKFSDGTPLTAAAAKQHFDAFKAGTTSRFRLAALQQVDVTGPMQLRFTLSTANPDFIRTLADVDTPGHIINPAALANPDSLDTTTAGTGPYMLDPAQSVTGDHYTFVQNPNYWDTRPRFKTIVVRNITDPAAALAAMQTGQADIASGTLSTAAAAKSAGMTILTAPSQWTGIGLIDRGGTVAKALGDVRVRQALNYAIDRQAIVKGIYGEYGTPTDGIATPGFPGYSEPAVANYPYDVAKAKQLMADAGYASGFSMPLLASSQLDPNNNLINAIADYWSKLGVTVQITNDPVNWATKFSSKQFPAVIDLNGNGLIAQANSQLLPSGTSFNPFGSSDDQINALFQQAVSADPAAEDTALKQMASRARDLAWFAPVVLQQTIVMARPDVPKFTIGPLNSYPQLALMNPGG